MTGAVAPVAGAVVRPLGPALAPVGSALAPVGSALAPITGAVGGLVGPVVPGGLLPLPGSGTGSQAGPGAQGPGHLDRRRRHRAGRDRPGCLCDESGPSGRRRRQLARRPVHPVLGRP